MINPQAPQGRSTRSQRSIHALIARQSLLAHSDDLSPSHPSSPLSHRSISLSPLTRNPNSLPQAPQGRSTRSQRSIHALIARQSLLAHSDDLSPSHPSSPLSHRSISLSPLTRNPNSLPHAPQGRSTRSIRAPRALFALHALYSRLNPLRAF